MEFNIVILMACLAAMMFYGHNHVRTKLLREIEEEKTLMSTLYSIIDQKTNTIANHWSNRSWIRDLPGFRWLFADGPEYQPMEHNCPVPDGKSNGILDFLTLGGLRGERTRLRCEKEALLGGVKDFVNKINVWNCSFFAKLRGKCSSGSVLMENLRSELGETTGQDSSSLLAKIIGGIGIMTTVYFIYRFISRFRTENSNSGFLEISIDQGENAENLEDWNEEGFKVELEESTYLDVSNESQMVNAENGDELSGGLNVETNSHSEEEIREEKHEEEISQIENGSDEDEEDEISQFENGCDEDEEDDISQFEKGCDEDEEDEIIQFENGCDEEEEDEISQFENGCDEEEEDEISQFENGCDEDEEDEISQFENGCDEDEEDEISQFENGCEEEEEDEIIQFENGCDEEEEDEISQFENGCDEEEEDEISQFENGCDEEEEDEISQFENGCDEEEEDEISQLKMADEEDEISQFENGCEEEEDEISQFENGCDEEEEDEISQFENGSDEDEEEEISQIENGSNDEEDEISQIEKGSNEDEEDEISQIEKGSNEDEEDEISQIENGSNDEEDEISQIEKGSNDEEDEISQIEKGSNEDEEDEISQIEKGSNEDEEDEISQIENGSNDEEDEISQIEKGSNEDEEDEISQIENGSNEDEEDEISQIENGCDEDEEDEIGRFVNGCDEDEEDEDEDEIDAGGINAESVQDQNICQQEEDLNAENCDELSGVFNVDVNSHYDEEIGEDEDEFFSLEIGESDQHEEDKGEIVDTKETVQGPDICQREEEKSLSKGNDNLPNTSWDELIALTLAWEELTRYEENEVSSAMVTEVPQKVSGLNGSSDTTKKMSEEIQRRCNDTEKIGCGVRPFGLRNMGNTCYMNSSLQVLMKALEEHADHLSEINESSLTRGLVAKEMHRLIGLRGKEKVVLPVQFRNLMASVKAAYGTKEQQDASEFFFDVLERLNDDLNRVRGNKDKIVSMENTDNGKPDHILAEIFSEKNKKLGHSMITELFQGLNRFTKDCLSCGKRSVDFGMSMDVALTFPNESKRYSLQELFASRFQEELLDDYKCDFCHDRGHVVRKEDPYVLPEYLVVRLNRFAFSMATFSMRKIVSVVDFPEEMRLEDFSGVNGAPTEKCYDLQGIVNHYGKLDFGHYSSAVKGADGRWIDCNDDLVKSVSTLDCKGNGNPMYDRRVVRGSNYAKRMNGDVRS
ncbi:uncharacterized protein [Palaemon carinicauda]|uniref:uncharacterized protein n=1 Tax=Palaemon carinicauda TaxID=392227 RepID=UPI0035B6635E